MNIRQLRLEKGWSQIQLAELSGLSLRTVQRIEKGSKPTIESLKAIASVFETEWSELVSPSEFNQIDESKLSNEELLDLEHIREVKRFLRDCAIYLVSLPFMLFFGWRGKRLMCLTPRTFLVLAGRNECSRSALAER